MKLKIFCHRKPIMKYGLTIKPKDVKIKEIISGGDCMKLVELIRRMHFHSKLQLKKGRRLHITDERFLKEAEKMVCDEVSVVLHIDRNDVLPLVLAG